MSRHPETEELLRYADGESPARDAAEIRSHLEACWECRSAMDELQKTIAACVRYRKNVLEPCLPAPPAPWTDIYRGFDQIDAAVDRTWRPKRWLAVAAAVIVSFAMYYRFRQTPSVQAAELLRKAIAAADASSTKPRRIRIRTRDRSLTRVAGERTVALDVEPLFAAANYDWADPLSAKAYRAWREQLADKQDEVVEERGAYRIRTSTGSGPLASATLTIRAQDLAPIEERLEFRNREWVEISEIVEEPPPAMAGAAPKRVNAQNGAKSAIVNASVGAELRVLATLHELGADLGDPIEVSRSGGAILVAGLGVPAPRQQQIQDALRSQTNVVVRFSDPAPAAVEAGPESSGDTAISPEVQQLQTRMAEQLGGRALFAQLASQALDLSEPMMARVYALRRLAEQIPAEAEPELTADDRQVLRGLQREHVEALRRQTAEIERLLRPALGSLPAASADSTGAWQPATEELFQSARQVEKLLAVMFGGAAADGPADRLPSQLLSRLAEFRAKLEAYERRIK